MYVTQRSAGRVVKSAGALVVVLLATVLAGCGGSPAEPAGSAGGAATQRGAFPRTIEHAMGTTTIEKQPQRVVALDRTFTDATLALNTEVVGRTTFTPANPEVPPYLQKAGGKYLEGAHVVGTLSNPSLEEIAQLNPDLILSAKVRHQRIYDELSKIAPTVFSRSVSTWKSNLELTGRALGKEQLVKSKIEAFERRAGKIGDAIRAKLGHNPTVTLVRFAGEPTVRLYTRQSYPGQVIYQGVGLARPKDAPTSQDIAVNLSPERILDLDAEYIFVATYKGGQTGKPEDVREKFQSNPLWQKLRGEIVTVSDPIWFTSVGLLGAQEMLDSLTRIFGVDPAGSTS